MEGGRKKEGGEYTPRFIYILDFSDNFFTKVVDIHGEVLRVGSTQNTTNVHETENDVPFVCCVWGREGKREGEERSKGEKKVSRKNTILFSIFTKEIRRNNYLVLGSPS